MDTPAPTRRLILDASIDRSVISGTLTAPSGELRDVHGWLELNTALEAMLATSPVISGCGDSCLPPFMARLSATTRR